MGIEKHLLSYDEALWHPVIGEESAAVTSAPVGRSTYRERSSPQKWKRKNKTNKKKKQWGFWAALLAGFSVAEDWVS